MSLLTTPDSLFPAIAQTTDARKAEADRLMQQGMQQSQTGQLRAALNSWQQALQIYRTIKNRLGEGLALNNFWEVLTSLWATMPKPLSIHSRV
jgi:hypothetical protein